MKLSNGVKLATFSLQVYLQGRVAMVLGDIISLAARVCPGIPRSTRPFLVPRTGENTSPQR
jgi:hypothetical protein